MSNLSTVLEPLEHQLCGQQQSGHPWPEDRQRDYAICMPVAVQEELQDMPKAKTTKNTEGNNVKIPDAGRFYNTWFLTAFANTQYSWTWRRESP